MAKDHEGKKKESLFQLRKLLNHPNYAGRVVKPSELIRKMKIPSSTFYKHINKVTLAQEWLAANQDAPLDAKRHYEYVLREGMENLDSQMSVHVNGSNKSKARAFTAEKVSKQIPLAGTSHALRAGKKQESLKLNAQVTMKKTVEDTEMVELSKVDGIIQSIKEAFVLAALGEMPDIKAIMKEYGLLDSQGNATGEVTEAMVREKMVQDDWKYERELYLYRSFDIVQAEIDMVALQRNLEVHRALFNEIKIIHRMNIQYYQTGVVKTLDGSKIIEDYKPDHGTMAGMSEVMRRMLEGGTKFNIMVNNFNKGSEEQQSVNQANRELLQKIAGMSVEELEEETRRLEVLGSMLVNDTSGKITIEDIEAQERGQVIDVTPNKEPAPPKPPVEREITPAEAPIVPPSAPKI